MSKLYHKTDWTLLSTGMAACLLLRLTPLRMPNVEPILATQMPFAKAYGKTIGFIFGVASVLSYDFITGTFGAWSFFTAGVYGLVGVLAARFFQKRAATRRNFVSYAIFATLLYDALTGLTVGPLFFHQSFLTALVGQLPFTAMHLFGSITFSLIVSPSLYIYLSQHQRTKREIQAAPLLAKSVII